MGQIFLGLLMLAPLAALVLFFSLEGKQEIKNEQRLQSTTQTLESKKFDDEFSDSFNGKPGKKTLEKRNAETADLQKEVNNAKAKRDELDRVFDDAADDMKSTIRRENERLKKMQKEDEK